MPSNKKLQEDFEEQLEQHLNFAKLQNTEVTAEVGGMVYTFLPDGTWKKEKRKRK